MNSTIFIYPSPFFFLRKSKWNPLVLLLLVSEHSKSTRRDSLSRIVSKLATTTTDRSTGKKRARVNKQAACLHVAFPRRIFAFNYRINQDLHGVLLLFPSLLFQLLPGTIFIVLLNFVNTVRQVDRPFIPAGNLYILLVRNQTFPSTSLRA